MRSFAVWYSLKENEKFKDDLEKKLDIHINLWNKKGNNKYCFDFGFMIEDMSEMEYLYLYCPFEVTYQSIKDLGKVISEHKLVNAIFNENYTTTSGEAKRVIVNDDERKEKFIIYSLAIKNQVEIIDLKDQSPSNKSGTILKINLGEISLNDIKKHYFRLRIEADKSNIDFIEDDIRGISIFNDSFTNTEIIDFRLNDTRSFRDELKERYNDGLKFQITSVHYLILRDANDSIIHFGDNINSRMLEKNLWNEYIESDERKIIAYHIKKKAKKINAIEGEPKIKYVTDFSNLSRFQYKKKNIWILLLYVLGIIIFGAIGSLVATGITALI